MDLGIPALKRDQVFVCGMGTDGVLRAEDSWQGDVGRWNLGRLKRGDSIDVCVVGGLVAVVTFGDFSEGSLIGSDGLGHKKMGFALCGVLWGPVVEKWRVLRNTSGFQGLGRGRVGKQSLLVLRCDL